MGSGGASVTCSTYACENPRFEFDTLSSGGVYVSCNSQPACDNLILDVARTDAFIVANAV